MLYLPWLSEMPSSTALNTLRHFLRQLNNQLIITNPFPVLWDLANVNMQEHMHMYTLKYHSTLDAWLRRTRVIPWNLLTGYNLEKIGCKGKAWYNCVLFMLKLLPILSLYVSCSDKNNTKPVESLVGYENDFF